MEPSKDTAQEAYLNFLEKYSGTWNEFNGSRIVQDLRANRHLWQAASMSQNPLHPWAIGIILRDLQYNRYAVDTLYILADRDRLPELERLAQSWNASDVETISEPMEVSRFLGMTSAEGTVVYSLWWD